MGIQEFILDILFFINETLIPFIIAIAFLVFIWNVARYFIIGGANDQDREKAKRLALYGILAFVIIVSLWGIVNVVVGGLGFNREQPLEPDYVERGSGFAGEEDCSELFGVFIRCSERSGIFE